MYGNTGAAGSGAAGLAYTGFQGYWLLLAVIALIMTGLAIRNLLPKQEV